jgi:hypothetical protein
MKKILLVLAVALPLSLIVLSVTGPVNHSSSFLNQPAVTTADGGTPLPSPIPPQKNLRQSPNTSLMADGAPLPSPIPPQKNLRQSPNIASLAA